MTNQNLVEVFDEIRHMTELSEQQKRVLRAHEIKRRALAVQRELELLTLIVPTGEARNKITDANIAMLLANMLLEEEPPCPLTKS